MAEEVKLAWDANSESEVAGYRVYYAALLDPLPKQITVTGTTATVQNLVAGTTYYFYVTAFTGNGLESLPSEQITYKVPAATIDPDSVIATPIKKAWAMIIAAYSQPGTEFLVESTSDIGSGDWVVIGRVEADPSGALRFYDWSQTADQMFYRLIQVPISSGGDEQTQDPNTGDSSSGDSSSSGGTSSSGSTSSSQSSSSTPSSSI